MEFPEMKAVQDFLQMWKKSFACLNTAEVIRQILTIILKLNIKFLIFKTAA